MDRFTRKERKKTQMNRITNERREVAMGTTEIQRPIQEYYETLCTTKFDNLKEMGMFLELYYFLRLNHEKLENLKKQTNKQTKKHKKTSPNGKHIQDKNGFTGEFYLTFKEDLILIIVKICQNLKVQ